MPGLAGVISQTPEALQRVHRMIAAFAHGPDIVRGTHSGAAPLVHVGWSLLRASFADALPACNASRDVVLYLSGEVFTEPQDLERLRQRGHPVDAASVSHLVQLYEEFGEAFLGRLNGSFCGLLVDRRRGVTLLFNDRYGAGRLYLHENADGLHFASEVKGLLAVLPQTRRLDPAGVAETFSLGCVIQDRTLFEGITLLPAGSCWTIADDGRITRGRYFDPAALEQQEPLAEEPFYEALRDTFAAVLPPYLAGSPSPAMSLTGGLDGRMILAWARPAPGSLPCFSFGGMFRDCHDVKIARRIATMLGQEHRTLVAGEAMLRQFPDLAEQCVEVSGGTMDVSGAVEVYVNRLAREISPIRITGNYGSEIVRGNVAFRPRRLDRALLDPAVAAGVDQAEQRYRDERAVRDLSFIAFKQVPWHHHARLSVEQSIVTMRSPFLDNRLVALMFRAPPSMRADVPTSLRLIHDGTPGLAALPTDRGLVHGPRTPLVKLRHAIREFSVRAEYAYDYGMPQWLVRADAALGALHLERLFLGRHKFYHFRTWYRGPLAGYLRDMLTGPNTLAQRWFAPGALRRMVEEHTTGRANHTLELHRALTLELIERRLTGADAHA